MITLTLLHPIQLTPVQSWTFDQESVIRIGRSTDNHVILYSAVVSRHHVELRRIDSHWEIVNIGANGTYLDGKRVTQVPVEDGVIIRLARSGPNIQIHIGTAAADLSRSMAGEKTLAQRGRTKSGEPSTGSHGSGDGQPDIPVVPPSLPVTIQPEPDDEADLPPQALMPPTAPPVPTTAMDVESPTAMPSQESTGTGMAQSSFQTATEKGLFCQQSGKPLQILQSVGGYKAVKVLQQDAIGVTQVVWRDGQSLLLRTLNTEWLNHPEAIAAFEQQAKILVQLRHPGIPKFLDFFTTAGRPYLIFEWVHGQDLRQQVVNRGALPFADAIATLLEVCEILDYLHQHTPPVVHEDVRPETLIQRFSHSTSLSVTLVGFASLNTLAAGKTLVSAGYMAPELQQGFATPVSDLFALGPMLIYLLTGIPPNEFYTQREQGFRLYPEYVPGLSPDVADVIRRLTNPHPEDRYRDVKEVVTALQQLKG